MENTPSNFEQLLSDIYRYVNLRLNEFKLRTIDGLSSFLSLLFSALICILLLNIALLFVFGAVAVWISAWIGSLPWALLITGGFFLLLTLLVFVLRRQLITDRFVSALAQLFFEEKEDDDEND